MFKIFFVTLLFCQTIIFAEFKQIFSLKEIESEIESSDGNVLVVFDIDAVLIESKDQFFHPYADPFLFAYIQEKKKSARSLKEKKELEETMSLSFILPERSLIEEDSSDFIARLQEQGIKVMALTSFPTGKLGFIPSLETFRIEHLRSLGVSFVSAFPSLQDCLLQELARPKKPTPLFQKGFLFSPEYPKGEVLKSFLKTANFRPSKVIFVDDLVKNLESVEEEMKSLQIECHVYHYTGASRFHKPLNEKLLQYQLDYLVETRRWLSDEEVLERLLED